MLTQGGQHGSGTASWAHESWARTGILAVGRCWESRGWNPHNYATRVLLVGTF